MAVPAALDDRSEVTTETDPSASARPARGFRWILLGLLVLALVATAVWIPILLAHRQVTVLGKSLGNDDAAAVQADREAESWSSEGRALTRLTTCATRRARRAIGSARSTRLGRSLARPTGWSATL